MTDSMTDPHQEAAALARAEAGVSAAVEALADVRARRSTFATAEAFDSAMLEAAWNILAARSAGPGSRVEREYDEAVESVHRAFCFPDHEQVGEWDRSMADALRRRGYAIVNLNAADCPTPPPAGATQVPLPATDSTPPPAVDGWTFEPLTGDGWAILDNHDTEQLDPDDDGTWSAGDVYGNAVARTREDAVRIVNALNTAPTPAPSPSAARDDVQEAAYRAVLMLRGTAGAGEGLALIRLLEQDGYTIVPLAAARAEGLDGLVEWLWDHAGNRHAIRAFAWPRRGSDEPPTELGYLRCEPDDAMFDITPPPALAARARRTGEGEA